MDAVSSSFQISPSAVQALFDAFPPPIVIDARRRSSIASDPVRIPGALQRDVDNDEAWIRDLEPWRRVVVYCVHGHERSQAVAAILRKHGFDARYLEGGLAQWLAAGRPREPIVPPSRWITRERPKIDRIACPWLIRRFIDATAEFIYVPPEEIARYAAERHATPYDVPDVAYTHVGANCSFDAFIARHHLHDPALDQIAQIVRGADTSHLELAAQSAGLLALSKGLSRMFLDDHAMLRYGMLVYDALYAWCRDGRRHEQDSKRAQARAIAA